MLQAVAVDTMFGPFLSFVNKGTVKNNPVSAVLVTSVLVQVDLIQFWHQMCAGCPAMQCCGCIVFNADPNSDLAFHRNVDPDPESQPNADPCVSGSGPGSSSDFKVTKN